ncbi:MAG: PLP-dependent aminotransferase family protein [Acidobacteriaceae bacterium]|jgi:GntR family transcriptional regulator/MocR family aminotransferase
MLSPIEKLGQFVFEEFGPPRYEQLAAFFERAIRAGEISAGDRLPTVRRLSDLMSVSATTISSAFDLLGSRKFVRAEVGRGTFVVSDWQNVNGISTNSGSATIPPPVPKLRGTRNPWRRNALMRASSRLRATYPSAMECSTGRPDAKLLPLEVIRQAWANCMQEVTSTDLQYAGTAPIQPLAEVLIPVLEGDLIPARTQDLMIGSSAQQFFALIYEVARVKSEKSTLLVAIEEPGYPTLMDTLERAGGRLVGIAVDRFGAVPASLDAALRDGARLVILTPRAHNPTGASWSIERLTELSDVLKAHPEAIVVEDDQVAGIAATKPGTLLSIPELENRVLHVRSFSKSIAPDLRMAAAVARPLIREPLSEAKTYADGWSSRLLQRVLAKTLQTDEINVALKKARDAYRDRRQSACAALNQIVAPRGGGCWSGSDGVNVWVRLPPGVDSKHIQERSAAAGVRIADGEPFFIAPGQNDVVRLNAGSVEAEDAAKAGKIVGQAILDCGWQNPGPIHV